MPSTKNFGIDLVYLKEILVCVFGMHKWRHYFLWKGILVEQCEYCNKLRAKYYLIK